MKVARLDVRIVLEFLAKEEADTHYQEAHSDLVDDVLE
jgi:hypothetical protein